MKEEGARAFYKGTLLRIIHFSLRCIMKKEGARAFYTGTLPRMRSGISRAHAAAQNKFFPFQTHNEGGGSARLLQGDAAAHNQFFP
jgi:hypothetical protein